MLILPLIALAALPLQCVLADPREPFDRAEAVKQRFFAEHPELAKPRPKPEAFKRSAKSPYLNSRSKKFVVNGTGLPDVHFDIGESFAGLLPISAAPGETRQLFFWFFPSRNPAGSNEIGIWLNGGPGCSSLSGLLTENGPFLYQAGTHVPTPNPYAWSHLTSYVWIEQPVGTGFSQGKPNITNEHQLAEQFAGFWKNFVDTFGLENRNVYITGESYAGFYVPYIADYFLEQKNTKYFNVKGIAINDPIIGNGNLQTEYVVAPFVNYWNHLLYLSKSSIDLINTYNEKCGYADYSNTYFTFPPPQRAFPHTKPIRGGGHCDIFSLAATKAFEVNPCFNFYHISDTCPFLYGHLGIVNTGDYVPPGAHVYFNRPEVKKAINAPLDTTWYQCARKNVFVHNFDHSPGPALDGTLQSVIEKTNNVIIGNGGLDFLLPTNGTLFALQNMTWNGFQGLKQYPSKPFFVPHHQSPNRGAMGGSGNLGVWTEERGVTFYTVQQAGHEVPGYALTAGFRMLELLLGRIKNLSSKQPLFLG